MSNELQLSYNTGKVCYFIVRNSVGQAWNTGTLAFENYATANYGNYKITATEQGSASGFYTASMPTSITGGIYSIVGKTQPGGSPAESDPVVAIGNFNWDGTISVPLANLATSGLIASTLPMKIFRGQMVKNFPFKMVSAVDHVTNFTSGVVSGQISRDGGSFGPLQSGAFTEIGNGWYSLQALTSGDLLANSVALMFTATGISGGTADQRDIGILLQRISGSI